MNRNIQILISIKDRQKLKNMTQQQNKQFAINIKKQSTYFFFNANRAIQARDFPKAKQILIYLADASSCVKNPDSEIQQILEICCQYLAVIKKKEAEKKNRQTMFGMEITNLKKRTNLVVLKYNKFSGGFQFDQNQKKKNLTNADLLFYISQLNSILFSTQNNQNQHSMLTMFKSFTIAFITALLLILTICGFYISKLIGEFIKNDQNSSLILKIVQLSIVAFFLIPLIIIFVKKPFQKNSNFFQMRLGQKIESINKQCKKEGKSIIFFMPEGIQINVKVQQTAFNDQYQSQQFQLPNFELRNN